MCAARVALPLAPTKDAHTEARVTVIVERTEPLCPTGAVRTPEIFDVPAIVVFGIGQPVSPVAW